MYKVYKSVNHDNLASGIRVRRAGSGLWNQEGYARQRRC
jgi:hypothetical protein